jgi:hypothetical protein
MLDNVADVFIGGMCEEPELHDRRMEWHYLWEQVPRNAIPGSQD